jgi:exonuclease I
MWGQLDCVKELVRAGADHRLRTKSGQTSQQLALRYRNTACSDYLSSVEARRVLNEAAQEARGMLADSELIAGRWNKEDKAKVTALCQEKEQWLAHSEECFEEIVHQTNDFRVRIQPYFDKLQLISRKTG